MTSASFMDELSAVQEIVRKPQGDLAPTAFEPAEEPRGWFEPLDDGSPAAGPSHCAIATARFGRWIAEGAIRSSSA